MNIYKFNDNVYIDKEFTITLGSFTVTKGDIRVARDRRLVRVEVELNFDDDDLEKATKALGINPSLLRSTFSKKFTFRGRRTEEQKQGAIDEAVKDMEISLMTSKYERKLLEKFRGFFQERLERKRKAYLEATENYFTDGNPIKWGSVDDEELDSLDDEITEVQKKMEELAEKRKQLKARKRERQNELFAEYLEDHTLNDIWSEDTPFSPVVDQKIKALAERNELFAKDRELNFLA